MNSEGYPTPGQDIAVTVAALTLMLGALAVASGVTPTPDVGKSLARATNSIGAWMYLVVAALAFLETAAFVGLLVPGEIGIVVGGVAAANGKVSLIAMIVVVWIAAAGGDLVSFFIGRRRGRRFLEAHGARLRIRPEHLDRADAFFARHGGRAILIARFVGILRALMPFVAGASLLPLRRFLPLSILGGLTWGAMLTLVGYSFADSFESAGETATRVALGGAVLAAIVLAVVERLRHDRPAQP
jgi:membrane protein DedA with SNARE-associated domain